MQARPLDLIEAAARIRSGGVIAYPTEAVWGLGCDPHNAAAVERILALKGRPSDKGMLLLAGNVDQVEPLLAHPDELRQAAGHWPGPVTFVFSASKAAPRAVCAGDHSIAVRVTDHVLAAALALASGVAIVSTSANPAGLPPAVTAEQVSAYFGNAIDGLLEGETGGRDQPSRIIDARSGQTLR